MLVLGVTVESAPTLDRIPAASEHRDAIPRSFAHATPRRNPRRGSSFSGKGLVGGLEFLKADHVGLCLGQILDQPRQPRLDAVDVVSDESSRQNPFRRRRYTAKLLPQPQPEAALGIVDLERGTAKRSRHNRLAQPRTRSRLTLSTTSRTPSVSAIDVVGCRGLRPCRSGILESPNSRRHRPTRRRIAGFPCLAAIAATRAAAEGSQRDVGSERGHATEIRRVNGRSNRSPRACGRGLAINPAGRGRSRPGSTLTDVVLRGEKIVGGGQKRQRD